MSLENTLPTKTSSPESSSDTDEDEATITAYRCMYCAKTYDNPYRLVDHKRADHSVQHAADCKRREIELRETGRRNWFEDTSNSSSSSSSSEEDSSESEAEESSENEEPVAKEPQVEDEPQVRQRKLSPPAGSSGIPSGSFAYSPISMSPFSDSEEEEEEEDSQENPETSQSAGPEEEVESPSSPAGFPDIIVDDVLRSLHSKLARWDSNDSFGGSLGLEGEGTGDVGGGASKENGISQQTPSLAQLHQTLDEISASVYGQNNTQDSARTSQGKEPSQVSQAISSLRDTSRPLVRRVSGAAETNANSTSMSTAAILAKTKKIVLKLKKKKTASMRSVGWRVSNGLGSPQSLAQTSFSASPKHHKLPATSTQQSSEQIPAESPSSKGATTATSAETSRVQYQCRICPDSKKYLDTSARDRHEVSVHCCILTGDDQDGKNRCFLEKTAAIYKCDDCSVPYRFQVMLKKHKRDCLGGKNNSLLFVQAAV